MRIVLALALVLAGCAAKPAEVAPPPAIVAAPAVSSAPKAAVNDLPAIFNDTWADQKRIVSDPASPAKTIRGLQRVDSQAMDALRPWRTAHPHPTPDQIERAIVALSALKTYLALEAPAHGPKPKGK